MHTRKLTSLKQGEMAQVASLDGGQAFQKRLRTIGLKEGSTLELIAKEPANGPLVIKSGNTTLTLGRGMADKIILEPEEK
ncbi:ferrous iron transport protein A [Candidatus Altiarchaeota archaeon]